MIFRSEILDKIKINEVSLAFRRWRKLSIKVGGTLRTEIGVLEFTSIEKVQESHLKEIDAKKSGFKNLENLIKELNTRPDGEIYKIKFKLIGEDPRIGLREDKKILKDDFQTLLEKLHRLDRYSKSGPWTYQVLEAINQNPASSSSILAEELQMDQAKLKLNVRKLKNLGLTISLGTGYKLSPRGKTFLSAYKKATP